MEVESEGPLVGALGLDNSVDSPHYLRIIHIDVNQGESTLILHYEGEKIGYAALIDGGKAQYHQHILSTLQVYGVERLDAVINTHFDADHIEGLTALMQGNKFPIVSAYDRGTDKNDDKPRAFRIAAGGRHKPMSSFKTVNRAVFSLECLYSDAADCLPASENNASTIMQVKLGNFVYYTAGDQCHGLEYDYAPAGCAAFKCGHHGSKHSTSEELLTKMGSQVAFISAGSHSYCHPDHSVLEILNENVGIRGIYLTNCSYNRPQVNAGYLKEELEHWRFYVRNIANAMQIMDVPKYVELCETLREATDAADKKDWEAYSAQMIALEAYLEEKPPKALKKAIEAAVQAARIYDGEHDRERENKAWVAGSSSCLGNIELFVCAAGYAVGFFSADSEPVWHLRDHNGQTIDELPLPDLKPVRRSFLRDVSFSLLTAQVAGEEVEEVELSSKEKRAREEIREYAQEIERQQQAKNSRACPICKKRKGRGVGDGPCPDCIERSKKNL